MNATAEHTRVAVALCDCLGAPGARAELATLCESLELALPDVRAAVVPGLCRAAGRGPALASSAGATRLVVGVCSDGVSRHEVQRQARRAGLDPFAVEVVCLPRGSISEPGLAGAAVRLAAAVARMRAFAGTEPEQLRPRLLVEGTAVSRRALLTLPPVTYEAVPSVEESRCLGATRCRLCVQVCPLEALGTEEDRVVLDKQRCETCGLCLTVCPTGAVDLPGSSLPQYEAQLEVLLGADEPAVLFCCRGAAAALAGATGGWLPVEVPCVGMVTPGWALQALAGGATAVGLAPCEPHCRLAGETVHERVSYLRDLLHLLGDDSGPERVQLVAVGEDRIEPPPRRARARPPGSPGGEVRLSEPAASAEALRRLAGAAAGAPAGSLAHAASPLGRIHLRGQACTLCGACAAACPTAALRLEETPENVVLRFEPAACVACGRCALDCPETAAGTLHVEQVTDLDALAGGAAALKTEPLIRCRSCGRPIAPRQLLGRIRELLAGEENADPLLRIVGELCADCRFSPGGRRTVAAAFARPSGRSRPASPVASAGSFPRKRAAVEPGDTPESRDRSQSRQRPAGVSRAGRYPGRRGKGEQR